MRVCGEKELFRGEKKIQIGGEFVGQVGSVKCKYFPQANWMCMLKMEKHSIYLTITGS